MKNLKWFIGKYTTLFVKTLIPTELLERATVYFQTKCVTLSPIFVFRPVEHDRSRNISK